MKFDTEHINQYLNGQLSESEVKALEEKMETDEDFAYEVELHQMAIQVVQYPNFMREIKNVRHEIALEDESPALNQSIENGDTSKTYPQKERETPIIEMKPKRPLIIRRLLAVAASLLLIILSYYTVSLLQQPSSPMASTTDLIIKFESGTKGEEGAEKTPLQQGIEFFEDKKYQNAIPLFDQVIRENPNKRTDAQFLKAEALHYLGRKDDARTVLQSIRKADDEKHYEEAQLILDNWK